MDVVIIGGGPAGAVAGITLARAGIDVALIEKRSVPRDKVCGDALIPDSLAVLDRLGVRDRVLADAHRVASLRLYSPSRRAVRIDAACYCVRRRTFDTALLDEARNAGVHVIDGAEARSLRSDTDRVSVVYRKGGEERAASCRLVVVACGASAKTLAALGLRHRTTPSAVALRAYFRLADDVAEDQLHIWFERDVLPAYAWAFPMGDHVFNVGAGTFYRDGRAPVNLREAFGAFVERWSAPGAMLAGAEPLTDVSGAPMRTGLTGCDFVADNVLVAGEALGTTYPFSGEGIGKAMETGVAAGAFAARALHQGSPLTAGALRAYEDEVRQALAGKYRHYAVAQHWLRYPAVVDLLAWRIVRSRRLQTLLSDIFREDRSPTEILSTKGILKALFLPG